MSATVDIASFDFNPFFSVQEKIDAIQSDSAQFFLAKIKWSINKLRLHYLLVRLDQSVANINQRIERTHKKVLAKVDNLSDDELSEAYNQLTQLVSDLERIVDVTRNIRAIAPFAYRSMLENRNKIADCIEIIYDKVYPPFSDLSDEELQIKRENLSHLYDL